MRLHRGVLVLLLGLLSLPSFADPPTHAQPTSYQPVAVITLPIAPRAFDISWVDPGSHRYYLGDRTNGTVDVVDTTTDTLVAQIGGFVGFRGRNAISGPDGVLVIPEANQLWVGDGDSTVKVIDLGTRTIIATIATGGQTRADEMAYDPRDHLFIVTNDAEDPPYLTFISTTDLTVVGTLPFPDATDGIEQPAWDPGTGLFFQAVPASKTNAGGEIAVIDPQTRRLLRVYPLDNCTPHGLVVGPSSELLAGCSAPTDTLIVDGMSGQVLATIAQVGGSDEVWYNPGDNHYYLAASGMTADSTPKGTPTPVLGIIDAGTRQWLANVPTVTAAHSVAADPQTNHIYVPLTNVGIGVYAAQGPVSRPGP